MLSDLMMLLNGGSPVHFGKLAQWLQQQPPKPPFAGSNPALLAINVIDNR